MERMEALKFVQPIATPPFKLTKPKSALKRKGIAYERKVHRYMLKRFGLTTYIPSQWFKYQRFGDKIRFCQTDGLLFQPKQFKLLIIEIKYKHTPDAYWQIENKYLPVCRWLFRDWEISTLEIVKWYDPSTQFPAPVSLRKDIEDCAPGEFGVHILTP